MALIHERQQLVECMEGLEAKLQDLNSLTTWLSVKLALSWKGPGNQCPSIGRSETLHHFLGHNS